MRDSNSRLNTYEVRALDRCAKGPKGFDGVLLRQRGFGPYRFRGARLLASLGFA